MKISKKIGKGFLPEFLEKTDKIENLKVVTQAEYDAIATPDPKTLYFIQ